MAKRLSPGLSGGGDVSISMFCRSIEADGGNAEMLQDVTRCTFHRGGKVESDARNYFVFKFIATLTAIVHSR